MESAVLWEGGVGGGSQTGVCPGPTGADGGGSRGMSLEERQVAGGRESVDRSCVSTPTKGTAAEKKRSLQEKKVPFRRVQRAGSVPRVLGGTLRSGGSALAGVAVEDSPLQGRDIKPEKWSLAVRRGSFVLNFMVHAMARVRQVKLVPLRGAEMSKRLVLRFRRGPRG
jgi:hypothetical protein